MPQQSCPGSWGASGSTLQHREGTGIWRPDPGSMCLRCQPSWGALTSEADLEGAREALAGWKLPQTPDSKKPTQACSGCQRGQPSGGPATHLQMALAGFSGDREARGFKAWAWALSWVQTSFLSPSLCGCFFSRRSSFLICRMGCPEDEGEPAAIPPGSDG